MRSKEADWSCALPVQEGGSVTADTGMPVCSGWPAVLNVAGLSHIASLHAGTADVLFNITPIED